MSDGPHCRSLDEYDGYVMARSGAVWHGWARRGKARQGLGWGSGLTPRPPSFMLGGMTVASDNERKLREAAWVARGDLDEDQTEAIEQWTPPGRPFDDDEAFRFYSDPANQEAMTGEGPVFIPDRSSIHIPRVYIPSEVIERVRPFAACDQMTVASWIRSAVRAALDAAERG